MKSYLPLVLSVCVLSTPVVAEDPPPPAKHQGKPNRLIDETSPYLLQHAHNPVDWRPWGPEALAVAKRENKPIMLSIGYSSCHWCHVMERESFLDKEIAKLLNEKFVCIKVDREERPDIDTIYMTALHVYMQMTRAPGNGGWPLTMFLTPNAEPFFGGTYFPARTGDRGQATGFLTIITRISELWKQQPERIEQDAKLLTRFVKQNLESTSTDPDFKIDDSYIAKVQTALLKDFDPVHGGFGYDPQTPQRPKFPEPSNLLFLLQRLQQDAKDEDAAKMLHTTLEKMAQGGIRDHLGGGFHRYSVDRRWDIPHFEKMLYDNGLLATAYSEAYALTERPAYRRVVMELARFIDREMTDEGGGFFAALDAESDGVEGKFYRWTREELQKLTKDDYQLFAAAYGLNGPPNFEAPYYALRQPASPAELAKKAEMTESQWVEKLKPVREKLRKHREQRNRPGTDFKILSGWNGLMIRGLADSGRIFEEPKHVEMAARAADFVLTKMRKDDGQLYRTYAKGEAKLNAYLDDYAYMVHGLIGLHLATDDQRWLDAAKELTELQFKHFWDEKDKGFFYTSDDHESLLARSRNQIDGAKPSGNSVAANNLLYLADALQDESYRQRAEETIMASSGLLSSAPSASPNMAAAAVKIVGN